jgi:phage terminase small subunit
MGITNKRRVFIDEYLKDCNATQAALRAGFAHPNTQGPRLLLNVSISDAIKARLDEKAMKADEVIERLTSMARGDMGDFMDIERMTFSLNLAKAKEKGLTHLIHKIKDRVVMTSNKDGEETETHTIEIELYDAHAALVDLGRYHKLFTENVNVNANINTQSIVTIKGVDYRNIAAILAPRPISDSDASSEGENTFDGSQMG